MIRQDTKQILSSGLLFYNNLNQEARIIIIPFTGSATNDLTIFQKFHYLKMPSLQYFNDQATDPGGILGDTSKSLLHTRACMGSLGIFVNNIIRDMYLEAGILVKTEQSLIRFAGASTPDRRNEETLGSEGDVCSPWGKGGMKAYLVLR